MADYKTYRIKGGGRVAIKNTSGAPDKEIARAVRFGLSGMDIGKCAVHVKKWRGGNNGGRAYYGIPWAASNEIPAWCRYLIVVRHDGNYGWLVYITGHEGRHIEDYRSGKMREIKRRRQGEARARAWGRKRRRDWEAQPAVV